MNYRLVTMFSSNFSFVPFLLIVSFNYKIKLYIIKSTSNEVKKSNKNL